MTITTLMEIEKCQICGQVSQDSLLDGKPPDGFSWSGERLTRKQTTSRPDTLWPEIWKDMSDAKRKEQQKWAIEKPKLDNARGMRGIFSVDPDDEEFKRIMKNARRKLINATGFPVPLTVEADEPMRVRMKGFPHKNHEDHIAGKRRFH